MGTRNRSSQMRSRSRRQTGRVIRNILGFLGLMALCFGLGFFVLSRLMPDTGKSNGAPPAEPTAASVPTATETEQPRHISPPGTNPMILSHAATATTPRVQAPPAVPPPTLEPTEEEKTQPPASLDAPQPSLDPPASGGRPADASVQAPAESLDAAGSHTNERATSTHSRHRRRRSRHTEAPPASPAPDTPPSTPPDSSVQQPAPLEPASGGNDKGGKGGNGDGNPP